MSDDKLSDLIDAANVLVATYYGCEDDDKDEQIVRCMRELTETLSRWWANG